MPYLSHFIPFVAALPCHAVASAKADRAASFAAIRLSASLASATLKGLDFGGGTSPTFREYSAHRTEKSHENGRKRLLLGGVKTETENVA